MAFSEDELETSNAGGSTPSGAEGMKKKKILFSFLCRAHKSSLTIISVACNSRMRSTNALT